MAGLCLACTLLAMRLATPVPGDLNDDGQITAADIEAFVLAVNDPATWCTTYERDYVYLLELADFDDDDAVTIDDIPGFAQVLLPHLFGGGGLGAETLGAAVSETVDLDIDSDNTDGTNPRAPTAYEDLIEDDPYETGKQIVVDTDPSSIPRTPAVLELHATGVATVPDVKFRLIYPANVSVAIAAWLYDSEESADSGAEQSYPYSHWILGDMNDDGSVNNFDLSPFILALTDRPAYYQAFPGLDPDLNGDISGDWVLANSDISPFVQLLEDPVIMPIPARLLVRGMDVSAAQGETRIFAEADTDADGTYSAADADAVRATVYDDDQGVPPGELGAGRPWGATLPVATFSAVNLRSGNLHTEIPIDAWPGYGPDVDFRLYHSSGAAGAECPTSTGFTLGSGWSMSYGGCLRFYPSEVSPEQITVIEDDGNTTTFTWNSQSSIWEPPAGVHDTLTVAEQNMMVPVKEISDATPPAPAWVLTRKNQWRRIFDARGWLLYHTDSNREPDDDQPTYGGLAIRVNRYPDNDPNYAGMISYIRDMTVCRRLDFHYDEYGQLEVITEEDVVNREWHFYYDGYGRLTTVSLWDNPYADPECDDGTCEIVWDVYITYDTDSQIATISDKLDHGAANNNPYEYEYDDLGRLNVVTSPALDQQDPAPDPSPQVLTYDYAQSPLRFETAYEDRRGKEWTCLFEMWGGIASVEDPVGNTWEIEYDSDRNPEYFTDERDSTWTATYDGVGNLLTLTDPLGYRRQWEYDIYSNVTTITPPLNNTGGLDTSKTVEFEYLDYYDVGSQLIADFTHLTKITEPDPDGDGQVGYGPAETLLAYHHADVGASGTGELKRVTDANSVQNRFTYHSHHGTLYDWTEGPDSAVDEDYYPVYTRTETDNGGRVEHSTQWNSSGTAEYNASNNPTTAQCTGREGEPTLSAPDPDPPDDYAPVEDCAWYILMSRCGGEGTCQQAEYDNMGNLLEASVTLEPTWKVLCPWITPPGAIRETSERTVVNTYDALYRLRTTTRTTQEMTATSSDYDDDERATVTRDFEFVPDENGNLRYVTDSEDSTTEYVHDDANRLTQVIVDSTTVVTYNYANWVASDYIVATYANGTSTQWLFDAAGHIDHITHREGANTLLDLDYTWTPDGLVSSIVETTSTNTTTVSFTYDKRGRLLGETRVVDGTTTVYDLTYTYDQLGNRLTMTDNLADPDIVTTYHYDTQSPVWPPGYERQGQTPFYGTLNNRLIWAQTVQGETTLETRWYVYNAGGHVKRIVTHHPGDPAYGIEHFQYNGAQQMWLHRTFTCQADQDREPINTVGLTAWEFRYTADRRRYLARARDATLPADQYDPYLEPLDDDPQDRFVRWSEYVGDQVHADFEMDLSGQTPVADVTARYVHAGGADGALVAMDGGPGYTLNDRRFFHQDLLGTARLLTGANGAVTQSLAFSAFGGVVGTAPAGSPRYGYAGAWGYQDDGLGTPGWTGPAALHVGARYYDPAIGRFLGRDPIGIFGGIDVYALDVAPTVGVDPSGLFTFGDILSAARTAVTAAVRGAQAAARAGRAVIRQVGRMRPRWMKNAKGFESEISKDFRVGWHGFKNKAGKQMCRPHYHRRPGIGHHRPWDGGW
ncbi:MAG: RHS repeat-associated core domain-containing protein [Phycisphaerae bacterium]|jgi:RHS repeat-associated protein